MRDKATISAGWVGPSLTSTATATMAYNGTIFADSTSAPYTQPTPEPKPDYSAEYDQYKYI